MVVETTENTLIFYVNGKKVEDKNVDPEWTLLYYLRNKLRLCGTKLGCGEGGCGACTVMISKYNRQTGKIVHIPANACLAPVCSMHGLAVTTVEGIGSVKTKLHPVQERIAKAHGSQCGFCTPGIVMSMYTLLRNTPKPLMKDLEETFQGNLCRCTGYRPIIDGYKTFTEEWELMQNSSKLNGEAKCGMGDQCCKLQNGVNGIQNGTSNGAQNDSQNANTTKTDKEILFEANEFIPYDSSQEPIFPPELKLSDKYDKQYLVIKGKSVTWFRPTKLVELLQLKKEYPEAKVVVGNTEVGVEVKFKGMAYPVIIQPVQIPEMVSISNTDQGMRVGASATLRDLELSLREQIKQIPETKTRVFQAIIDMLHWFAGRQIRSVGTIGGNIMTGSPISDLIPILMANKVTLEVQSLEKGVRNVLLDDSFFTGYRKSIIGPEEILLAIHVPYTHADQYFYAYKQARRREDDIAIVNMALNVIFEPKSNIIADINLAFGGMSYKTVMAPQTQRSLKKLPWNKTTLEQAFKHLTEDLTLDSGAPGGMVLYRQSLVLSLFFRGFLEVSSRLQEYIPGIKLDPNELSAIRSFQKKQYKTAQYFTVVPETQEIVDTVHRPIVHINAYKQATGEAQYCDDIPFFENELYLAYVISSRAHANILSIDPSQALGMDGVHTFVSAEDLDPEMNTFGIIVKDEKLFYDKQVTSQGQIIGAIVASDQFTAQKAAKMVKVEYEDLEPVIVTIQDAIKHNSYFHNPDRNIRKGDIEKVFKEAPHIIEGQCQIGGQEHFYLETQAAIVIPGKEDGECLVYSSTQNPTGVSNGVARIFGVDQNKVVTKVKRIGGGFGGKESGADRIAFTVAVAAKKLNRPVRCMLDRCDDFVITGGRHPFLVNYKVAFDHDGRILGLDTKFFGNCGFSLDMSSLVMERVMTHAQNAYNIEVVRIETATCKTNTRSNTAFRGFGGPQTMLACEIIMGDIAEYLKKDAVEIRTLNMYRQNDVTFYNQKIEDNAMERCWQQCVKSSNYFERKKEVEKFNSENRYKKRGITVIPTKYGVGFTAPTFNQGGALVLVYTDGSVLLSHGGVEIGQGLYTKMIQIATRCLEIPPEKIHTSETSTDKVPNTTPTVGSCTSDLCGMAVMDACNIIKERLRPFKEANPKGTWEDWVREAYLNRVSLSATGFYEISDTIYDWKTEKGRLYNYFTYGAACCEVEIDTLTGDHQVHRVDLVMDLGESLNPAIDIGQIEGAFMQGYGLFVLEELVYSPEGINYTRGPGTYKLPGFADIPGEFNVSLLKGSSNPRAVYSSKAVGEPPLFLGGSIFFAIKEAIKAARKQNGHSTIFKLDSPATSARIRMACQDNITSKFKEPEPGTFKPWSVVA